MNDTGKRWIKAIFFLLLFLSVVVGFSLLKIMADVIKPVVVAFLMSFVFFPLIKKLNERFKIPWWFGTIIVYALFFGIFFGIGNILSVSLKSVLSSMTEYENRFRKIYQSISEAVSNNQDSKFFLFLNFNSEQTMFENISNALNISNTVKSIAIGFTGTLFNFSKSFFMIILLSVFLLAEMHFMKGKIDTAFGEQYSGRVNSMIKNIITEVTRYISIKFVISLLTGTIVTVICKVFGMDFAIVWGFTAFILNFIPTFGSIISCGLIILFALIQLYPSPFPIVAISILVVITNLTLGNIIEPKIEGKDLGLSPFVILVSLSFWSWLWGIMGILLAVPLMVIVKIVCENISFLHPIAIFLGSKPKRLNDQSVQK